MENLNSKEGLEVLKYREQLLKYTLDFIEQNSPQVPKGEKFFKDLSELNYTLSENAGYIDGVDCLTNDQIIQCWKIVEALKNTRFPEDLYM